MDKKIIIGIVAVLVLVVGILFLTGRDQEPAINDQAFTVDQSREIAENWIVNNSPTYMFDGFNLEFVSEQELLPGKIYSFVFSFESSAAGFGERSDEILAQVITPHTIEVVVDEGVVVGAVTDRVFDEINQQMIGIDIDQDVPETIEISLYFVQVIGGQEQIIEVTRTIPYTVQTGRAAIEGLLNGPLAEEEAEGISSSINEGTELQTIEINNGVAFVDFSEELGQGVAGSAWVISIREQIEKTLMQFDTVEEVVISINGQVEGILEP